MPNNNKLIKHELRWFQDAVKMQNFKVHSKCICILKLPAKPLYKLAAEEAQSADGSKVQMHFGTALEGAYLIGLQQDAKMQIFLYI
jgi:hypothetical protein